MDTGTHLAGSLPHSSLPNMMENRELYVRNNNGYEAKMNFPNCAKRNTIKFSLY